MMPTFLFVGSPLLFITLASFVSGRRLGPPIQHHHRRQPSPVRTTYRSADLFAIARRPYREPQRHELGKMDVPCSSCGALHWMAERLSNSSDSTPVFGMCCNSGTVRLPPLSTPPRGLKNLYTGIDPEARAFRDSITQFNAALAFTSLGVDQDRGVNRYGPQNWVFRIRGALRHLSSALDPEQGQPPSYSQLYIYDPSTALNARMNRNPNISRSVMELLQNIMQTFNPYSRIYEHAYEVLKRTEAPDLQVKLRVMPGHDRRRYNLPTADEVAVILPGDGDGSLEGRDIVLRLRPPPREERPDQNSEPRRLEQISETHAAYAPLQYVLLFPKGDPGWHYDLRQHQPDRQEPKRLSLTRYTAFRLFPRRNEFSTILRGGRLLQQYAVDMWASEDQRRLTYLRFNQPKLRAEVYSGLQDAISDRDDDLNLQDLGRRYILPSSYIGGARDMQQRYQDAMALARCYKMVDVFATMTANPEWPEILRELLEGQSSYDRPDLVARAFNLKKKLLVEFIYKHGIFGHAVAFVYVIEFQKRGLPHIHLLIFLKRPFKLLTPEDIDSCIRARWPDPVTEPLLFETVQSCMVHGPCGTHNLAAPCMENGKCTKHYPKDFQETTTVQDDGYPLYARPNDGRSYPVGRHQVMSPFTLCETCYSISLG